jgi:hypothetical protein
MPLGEILAFVVVVGHTLGGSVTAGYWVYRDAWARGSDRYRGWATGTVLLAIVVLPLYLLVRRRLGERRVWRARDRTAGTVGAALLAGALGSAFVAPPDVYAQAVAAVGLTITVGVLGHVVASRSVDIDDDTQ